MYSLIIMMAMNGGTPAVPQFHPHTAPPTGSSCLGYGACTTWGYGSACPTNWSEGCVASTTWGVHPGCHGCLGGCLGGVIVHQPAMTAPVQEPVRTMPQTEEPPMAPKRDPRKPLTLNLPGNLIRSDVHVELPEGAKLYVNGSPSEIRSRDGRFETPALPYGREFSYSFKAVLTIGGDTRETTRRVTFKAGETVHIDFRDAKVAVK